MLRITIAALLVLFGLIVPAQETDPQALLHAAVNQLRGPAMAATYTLIVERPGRSKTYELRVFSDGDRRALIRVIRPKRESGQAFLTSGSDVWIYNPRLSRVLRLPPSGRNDRFLGSDVSYADLSGRDLEDFYTVSLGDSAEPGTILLTLTPKTRAPTPWGKVTLLLDAETRLPRKIIYYDQRGGAVKEISLRKAVRIGEGRYLVTDMLVVDRVRSGYRTVFTISDWKIGPVPERCLTKTALERGCHY